MDDKAQTPRNEMLREHQGYLAQTIHSELQALITQAAEIRMSITSAKTKTKKKYYERKFAKISTEVRQMVAALEQLKFLGNKQAEAAAPEVEQVVAENV